MRVVLSENIASLELVLAAMYASLKSLPSLLMYIYLSVTDSDFNTIVSSIYLLRIICYKLAFVNCTLLYYTSMSVNLNISFNYSDESY